MPLNLGTQYDASVDMSCKRGFKAKGVMGFQGISIRIDVEGTIKITRKIIGLTFLTYFSTLFHHILMLAWEESLFPCRRNIILKNSNSNSKLALGKSVCV